eukprot:gene22106-biopygen19220
MAKALDSRSGFFDDGERRRRRTPMMWTGQVVFARPFVHTCPCDGIGQVDSRHLGLQQCACPGATADTTLIPECDSQLNYPTAASTLHIDPGHLVGPPKCPRSPCRTIVRELEKNVSLGNARTGAVFVQCTTLAHPFPPPRAQIPVKCCVLGGNRLSSFQPAPLSRLAKNSKRGIKQKKRSPPESKTRPKEVLVLGPGSRRNTFAQGTLKLYYR